MSITASQAVTLLENVLFESPTAAAQNASTWTSQDAVNTAAPSMANSAEAGIPQEIVRLYLGVLGRTPSAAEVQYYVTLAEQTLAPGQLAQGVSAVPGQTWTNIVNDFANAPEFKADLAASDLISVLYHNVLGRMPSGDEVAYYQTQLSHGATTATLIRDFVDSPEYQSNIAATNLPDALAYYGAQFAQPGGAGTTAMTLQQAYAYTSTDEVGGVSTGAVTIKNTDPFPGNGGTAVTIGPVGIGSAVTIITLSGTGPFTLQIEPASDAGAVSSGSYHVVNLVMGTSVTPATVSLGFDSLSDSFAGTAIDVSHTITEAQALDTAAAAAGAMTAGSAKMEWFQFGGNTYMVEVTNAGAASTHTALAATDYIVKLAGLVDLSAASFNGGHTFTL